MDWDPLGVAGVDQAADEYDCMISPLLHRLYEGATAADLLSWISHERTEHFGLGPDDKGDSALAQELADWWRARTATTT